MVLSMTGYGKAETELNNKKITIEIKSLNCKQFDVNLRIPAIFRDKEMEIRNKLFQAIERGKVDFTILVETLDKPHLNNINSSSIENYYNQIKEIAKILNVKEPENWLSLLMRLPDTVKTESNELDETEWTAVNQTIDKALSSFVQFRLQEGEMLEKVFIEKMHNLFLLSVEIEKYESERIEKIKTRLHESIKNLEVEFDENRFAQEIVYYIEKLDISEEKARLKNHINYFSETMTNEKSQGRKLGFIIQEIGREINTLGSKSNHADMQKIVVQMKDELEQVKEQILNVL